MRLRGVSFDRDRVLPAAVSVVLVLVGSLLPNLRMQYLNFTVQLVDAQLTLFPAATLIRGVDPLWLPAAGVGWVPLTIAGVVILVSSFRARSRLDTYGGI